MALPVALAAVIPAVTSILGDVFDSLSEDKKEQATQALKVLETAQAESRSQARINAAEAAHRSVFVAGWRPFIGWVCGVSLLYAFFLHPLLTWLLPVFSVESSPPQLPLDYLLELNLGMLGLGGLRTFEKIKGVTK